MERNTNGRRHDRVTLGLAGLALGTLATVAAGEYARLVTRRALAKGGASSPVEAIGVAGQATQDTVAVALEGHAATPRGETVLFNMLSGFVVSFAVVRVSTAGIRAGWWPRGDVSVRGRHIHHFVPGILLAFGCGTAALLTDDPRFEEALAVPFGAGMGLTFDEAALLLDLRDVYWTREGLLSVQVSFATSALLAATILALRMLRRGEHRVEEQGLIPAG